MAFLPPVGTHGRAGPARGHDPLHGKYLLGAWFLARIRPLDRTCTFRPAAASVIRSTPLYALDRSLPTLDQPIVLVKW